MKVRSPKPPGMSRPFRVVAITLVLASSVVFPACKTPYTDMYSPRRNYYKPLKEEPKPSEALPALTETSSSATSAPMAPSLTPLPPIEDVPPPVDTIPGLDAPAPDAAPAPMEDAPSIPGL